MKHGRAGIREALKADLDRVKDYRHVGKFWNLSSGTVWKLLNQKGFWVKSEVLKNRIKEQGLKRGIVVGVRPLPKQED